MKFDSLPLLSDGSLVFLATKLLYTGVFHALTLLMVCWQEGE